MQEDSSLPVSQKPDQQGGNHYPPSFSNTFADILYVNRKANDDLLQKIIVQTRQNSQTEREIQGFKKQLPPFLFKWWNSKGTFEKLTSMMDGLSSDLQEQISFMNKKLRQQRAENELNEAEYEEEKSEREKLRKSIEEMEGKLSELKRKNQTTKSYSQYYSQDIFTLRNSSRTVQNIFSFEKQSKQDKINLINSFFRDQPFLADKQRKYLEIQESLVKFVKERKHYLTENILQLQECFKDTRNQISQHQREKKLKEHLKQSIVLMHQKVEEVRKKVEEARQKTRIAENKKMDLEKNICNSVMEKSVKYYEQLYQKYRKLTEKSVEVLKQTIQNPDLSRIKNMLPNE